MDYMQKRAEAYVGKPNTPLHHAWMSATEQAMWHLTELWWVGLYVWTGGMNRGVLSSDRLQRLPAKMVRKSRSD